MRFVPQTLDRVRAALRWRRSPGRHSRPATPQEAPQAPHTGLALDVRGARLARRRRRDKHAAPPQPRAERFPDWEAEEAWEPVGVLVRPYVEALGEAPRNAPAAVQGNPWEAAG